MRLYRHLDEVDRRSAVARAVAVGVFDGVHLGHREIIRRAVEEAHFLRGRALVLTFEPHPDSVLTPQAAPPSLTSLEFKLELLEEEGVDETAAIAFDPEFARQSPETFCRQLLSEGLNASHVLVGENFRFGAGAQGSPQLLRDLGQGLGFGVTAVDLTHRNGAPVSSTRIRRLLQEGRTMEAARLLGRPHLLEGYVIAGDGRGRALGVPTANIEVPEGLVIPAPGVYVSRSLVAGEEYGSVTSIGTNPTFDGPNLRVETHILEFDHGIYGQKMRVEFLQRLRGQERFPDVEALKAQMWEDIRQAESTLAAGG